MLKNIEMFGPGEYVADVTEGIRRVEDLPKPFIAFSTGKDSLAMAAMIYEAIAPDKLPCL